MKLRAIFNPSPMKLNRFAVAAPSTRISINPAARCDEFPTPPAIIIGLLMLSGIKFSTLKKKRQDIAKYYFSLLSNNINIRLLNLDFDSIVPHIFPIIIKNGTRDKIKNILLENNIQTGIHYKPNHLLSFYKCNNLTKTENIYLCLLTLPLHPDITFEQAEYISKIIINNIDE